MTNRNKIYFASDVHLGSSVFEEPMVIEKRFVRWLDHIKSDAKEIYLVGDIFDFWFEYKYVIPKGFTRFLGKVSELVDSGITVHFFIGNHDIWIFDYLAKETGAIIYKDPLIKQIGDKKFFITHGDGLGDKSRMFRFVRWIFHNRICQILFASMHPRWGIGLARYWSSHSRRQGLKNVAGYLGEDKEHLVLFAKDYLKSDASIDYFVFGHRHIMLDLMLSKQSRMVILGDWLQYSSYAVFDGRELYLEQWDESKS